MNLDAPPCNDAVMTWDGPLVGILGGMGPHATADFFKRLVERTPAVADQQHLRVAMWADPTLPDRTNAVLGLGPSPLPGLVNGLRRLEKAGVDYIAMPCNTAHAFLADLRSTTHVEIIDMISAALVRARTDFPGMRRIGVLATRGTRAAHLYEKAGAPLDLEVMQVDEALQARYVDAAIRLVKANHDLQIAADLLVKAIDDLHASGAEAAVAACTEIPVVLAGQPTAIPVIDATSCLIDAVLTRAQQPTPDSSSPQPLDPYHLDAQVTAKPDGGSQPLPTTATE